jgi:hypothetical protein
MGQRLAGDGVYADAEVFDHCPGHQIIHVNAPCYFFTAIIPHIAALSKF